jgi:hypothetical protein
MGSINPAPVFIAPMFWYVCLFVVAISYWMWVQKQELARVEEQVLQRRESWTREEQARRDRERDAERKAYVELVQRRLNT